MIDQKVLSLLLREDVNLVESKKIDSVSEWKAEIFSSLGRFDTWFDKAIAGGFMSDRLAYVFLSAYQAALHAKFPMLDPNRIAAFCVSEQGGNRPKAIQTTMHSDVDGYKLDGNKTFVTCAQEVDELLVATRDPSKSEERPLIKILHLGNQMQGMSIEEDKVLPFMPELRRGRLTLDTCVCPASSVLAGDGYADYIKPFSPLEALYVMAAGASYMIRLARLYGWPESFIEQSLSVLVSIQGAEFSNPEAAENQLLISGLKEQLKALVMLTENPAYWNNSDPDVYKRWLRDKVMFMMPDRAHSIRLERAWQSLKEVGIT